MASRTKEQKLREQKLREQKLREQKLRDEIERFNIEFMGPLLPSEWPAQYQKLFSKVQMLGATPWLLHKPENVGQDSDKANRWRAQQKAYELMNNAKADRRDRVNESTLRGNAEPLVFERLRKAAKWYIGTAFFAQSPAKWVSQQNMFQVSLVVRYRRRTQ
jgi:hypothetical protein